MTLDSSAPLPDADVARRRGRAEREHTPRSSLADLVDRPATFDPVAVLNAQGADRLADLLALRFERMRQDESSFLRGAAALMADDLARGPSSNIIVQICGDAHLSNFGVFSSPERRLVFDVNDFDETTRGPFEWDVKRLGASLAVAANQLGHSERDQEAAVATAVRSYRTSTRDFSRLGALAIWYAALDIESVMSDLNGYFSSEQMGQVAAVVNRAKTKDATRAFAKMVETVDGRPRIVNSPPLQVPFRELFTPDEEGTMDGVLTDILSGYSASLSPERQELLGEFTPIDGARKVVGVGSVGTRCFILLLLGRDVDDPFFLQIKEATASVVDVARQLISPFEPGERVVRGQLLMQATPDLFLGWHSLNYPGDGRRSFYVRQLYDNKAAVNVERLTPATMIAYARVCGWTLARAHARSGRSIEITGYIGGSNKFDDAIVAHSLAYRRRNASDFAALKASRDRAPIESPTASELPGSKS